MKNRRRRLLGVALLMVWGAWLFGWFPLDRSWQGATGWNEIPQEQLPPGGVSGRLFRDAPDGPEVAWLGHAGFLIQWGDQRIVLDPNFRTRLTLSNRFLEQPGAIAGEAIDLVCISHAHYDHLDPDSLRGLPDIGRIIIPSGSEGYLPDDLAGTPELTGLDRWESATVGPLTVTAVPAMHNGCRHHPWRSRYIAVGYVIADEDHALYFAGDTGYQQEVFKQIADRLHPDTAILPIGAYAPRIPFKIHHTDPKECVLAAADLGISQMIPGHFGTFRMTLDAPDWALPVLAREAARENLYWMMPEFHE